MTQIFQCRLVNSPFQDPALFVDFFFERRALLFDIGDVSSLSIRHINRITDIFISHTHMDHFMGLDYIIRIFLGREKTLRIFGPSGIIRNVEGKLSSYTWNLVKNYTNSFRIEVYEVNETYLRKANFLCSEGFKKRMEKAHRDYNGVLLKEDDFTLSCAILDHLTPSLAYCLEENLHININKDKLMKMGLPIGPWLKEVKTSIRQNKPDSYLITPTKAGDKNTSSDILSLGKIKEELVIITEGQKVAYVVDAAYTHENIEKILSLIEGATYFFCEAAFLEEDRERARERYHLTAYQAGKLAQSAKVKELIPFHFSPRYHNKEELLHREAQMSFKGQL
ncbi:MAG: ribonuclease Z [bacterium]